jgi:hypothetical protein
VINNKEKVMLIYQEHNKQLPTIDLYEIMDDFGYSDSFCGSFDQHKISYFYFGCHYHYYKDAWNDMATCIMFMPEEANSNFDPIH